MIGDEAGLHGSWDCPFLQDLQAEVNAARIGDAPSRETFPVAVPHENSPPDQGTNHWAADPTRLRKRDGRETDLEVNSLQGMVKLSDL
jgi:hypothetical protein